MKNKMKFLIIFLIIFLITILLIIFLKPNNKKQEKIKEIKDIDSFSFYYSNGYAINSDIRYKIECDTECIATIKPYGISEEDQKIVEVSSNIIDKLLDIFNEYEIIKWDGFDRYAKDVLDGDSFSFYLKTKDGIKINASGYMLWPDNYRLVRDKIDNIFNNI